MDINTELMGLFKEVLSQNQQLMMSLLEQQNQQQKMMQQMVGMYVPQGENAASSLAIREAQKELEEATNWEPMTENPFKGLEGI